MHTAAGFAAGILIGGAAGAGAVLAFATGGGGPALDGAVDHAECKVVETRLRTELAALKDEAAPRPLPEAAPGPAGAETGADPVRDPAPSTEPGDPRPDDGPASADGQPKPPADPAKARKRALKDADKAMRAQLKAVRDAEPGSAEVLALLKEWREVVKGDDPDLAQVASRNLFRLARMGKLRPDDAEPLAADFHALPPGHAARQGLSGAVARAWGRDPRLAGWLAAIPERDEPELRVAVAWALDETPSRTYRDWIVRTTRTEPNPDVVKHLFDEDIIAVTLTRSTAPKLAGAIEPRIAQGDLEPKTRARGYFALGLIAQQDPATARAALGRLAANEADAGVRAFAEGVLQLIDREESNVQALEGLWDQHRQAFGK